MWKLLEILNVFNTLNLKEIFWKTQIFFEKLEYLFLVESNISILNCSVRSLMLRQIEWCVQNGLITKNGVLPGTTLFFRIFCCSLRTLYKKLIWCTNHPNVHIHTFRKRWCFIWGCFFPVSTSGAINMRWAGPSRWDNFYPTFTQNLLTHFNQKVCYATGKILFWSCSF